MSAMNLHERGSFTLHVGLCRRTQADPSANGGVVVSYLVDPASSYMLVSKIKPCTCKYTL